MLSRSVFFLGFRLEDSKPKIHNCAGEGCKIRLSSLYPILNTQSAVYSCARLIIDAIFFVSKEQYSDLEKRLKWNADSQE